MDLNLESHPLRKFYRNITFDTLKERHDNFSFNKAVRTQQALNDTIAFQKILENPNDPRIVIFKAAKEDNGDVSYMNERYQDTRADRESFREFQK